MKNNHEYPRIPMGAPNHNEILDKMEPPRLPSCFHLFPTINQSGTLEIDIFFTNHEGSNKCHLINKRCYDEIVKICNELGYDNCIINAKRSDNSTSDKTGLGITHRIIEPKRVIGDPSSGDTYTA